MDEFLCPAHSPPSSSTPRISCLKQTRRGVSISAFVPVHVHPLKLSVIGLLDKVSPTIRCLQIGCNYSECTFILELSDVVLARLSVGGADDTHAVAGLEVAELQQHHRQIVDKQLRVHEGHGKLDDTMVVLILREPITGWINNIHCRWMKVFYF